MSLFDWIIVLAFNAPIIVYGFIRSKDTKSSADWFLAGRSLPWWMVGLSLYATAIDSRVRRTHLITIVPAPGVDQQAFRASP